MLSVVVAGADDAVAAEQSTAAPAARPSTAHQQTAIGFIDFSLIASNCPYQLSSMRHNNYRSIPLCLCLLVDRPADRRTGGRHRKQSVSPPSLLLATWMFEAGRGDGSARLSGGGQTWAVCKFGARYLHI